VFLIKNTTARTEPSSIFKLSLYQKAVTILAAIVIPVADMEINYYVS